MAIQQITFAFDGHRYGWSESSYIETPNENPTSFANSPVVAELRDVRQQFLANGYTLSAVRIQLYKNSAGERILRLGDLDEPNRPGNPTWSPAPPKVALMAKWHTPQGFERIQYMRGITSSLDAGGNAVTFEPDVLSAWNNLVEKYKQHGMGWLHQTVGSKVALTGYTQVATTGIVTITTDAPITPVAAAYVVTIAMPQKHPLDGRWKVYPTNDPTKYQIGEPVGVRPFDGVMGTVTRYNTSLVTVAAVGQTTGQIEPQRITTRNPGRPLYASRGRGPKRVKW